MGFVEFWKLMIATSLLLFGGLERVLKLNLVL
jgi:hypothetical protein